VVAVTPETFTIAVPRALAEHIVAECERRGISHQFWFCEAIDLKARLDRVLAGKKTDAPSP
jgi:hypothetical protein